MNLRAQYFEQLELILSDQIGVINRYEKLAKHNIYVKRVVAGLKCIKKTIRRIVEYSADATLYCQAVDHTANYRGWQFWAVPGDVCLMVVRNGAAFGLCLEGLDLDFEGELSKARSAIAHVLEVQKARRPLQLCLFEVSHGLR